MLRASANILRYVPVLALSLAVLFMISQVLLDIYPSNPMLWAFYLTMLPVLREPINALVALPYVSFETAGLLLVAGAALGLFLVARPRKFLRTEFVFTHTVMASLLPAIGWMTGSQVALADISLLRLVEGDWSFVPDTWSPLGALLFTLALAACVQPHLAVVKSSLTKKSR